MRDPSSAAAKHTHTNTAARSRRGRPRARESSGLMSRCKSAPDRFAAHLEQHETEDHEASWGPTATSSLTTGSGTCTNTSTVRRALGQGTIDQYFTVKVKDERVETVRLPLSAGLPHRSTLQRPRTSRRREPPPSPTTSSTCKSTYRTVRGETNVAEQRDDTHNDTRIKKIVTTVSRFSPSSQESVGTNATSSSTVQGDPDNDESTTCECTATKIGTTSADGSGPRSVHLLKKGKYSTRLSRESQRSRENRSRSSERERMAYSYSCRTVLIPPGKVGAVLHTSPLGPSIKTIKPTSPIYDQIAVGDVVVEVDGIDTTSARAKEVTMMLINGAEGERRIVVLRKETSDQDRSQDDGSSIEEDSPADRYLDFQDDEKDDDDAAVLSASVASGATTVAAGNTQAHKRARKNLTKDLSTNAKIRSEYLDTFKGAYSATGAVSHICEAAEEPIWETPERSMDAETPHVGLLDANKSVESRRSAAMGEESCPPAPASELIANRSSPTPMTIQVKKYDSDDDDDEMLTSAISTTGSVSSLSGSAECSQFGVNCTIGPIVHDEREKVPLSPIGEESTNYDGGQGLVQQSLTIHQDTYISMESQHDGVVPVITGEHESNAITDERTQPGFDLFLEGMGEDTSTSLSTLTPSLADGGRDNQTEKSTEKSRKSSIGIRSESPWQNPLFADAKGATSGTSTDCGANSDSDSQKWAELTVLAASTVLSSGGTKQLAKRAADSVLSLCNESPTCVDFQSLASIVSLEILEAGGDRVVASAVLGSILRYQKETAASKLVEDRREDSVTSTNSLVLLPLPKFPVHSLLDVPCISAKPHAKQNAKHHRFFQGTEAGVDVIGFVSSLSASRDAQIVQDALQFSSLLQQSTLAPRSTSTSASIPEKIEEKPTAQQTPSHVGLGRSFSTYQLCSRTLIVAEADDEIELFFPANDFEQLDRHSPLHVCIGQQDASAATNKDESKPQLVGIGPAKSLATAPTSNVADGSFAEGIPECSTERVPRSMLERWRSARRRQRAKARLRAVVKV